MSVLFQPIKIHGMPLRNRFVRSATHEASCNEQGEITDDMIRLYSRLAQGSIGLIITGFAYVHRSGQAFLRQTAIDRDDIIPGLKKLADCVHEYDAKIAIQLVHCGKNSWVVRERGEVPLAPSWLENNPALTHRAMTEAEIEDMIDAFGRAARRAREAGFDAIQLHAGHSYLFSQFLSPHSNQRTDRWGGNLENRLRFHMGVVRSIRQSVGQDYPLLIKLGVRDGSENGLTLEEGCTVARRLSASGVDAIEVSEGLEKTRANHIRKNVKLRDGEAYYAEWAREVKKVVNVPVILVGGMRSFDIMERLVQENYTDAISMCRPFIREPGIVHRWQTEDLGPAKCISCNLCLERVRGGQPVECVQETKLSQAKAERPS